MIKSRLMLSFFGLAALALQSAPASAKVVVIDDHRCVDATITRAHQSITDYADYSKLPGALYSMSILGHQINLLQMIKSQSRYFLRTDTQTDGYVWVVLQPLNVTNGAHYPQFLLHCTSAFDSPGHFVHRCNLVQDKTHFGLQNFTSTLDVTANSPECSADQTRLDYELLLDSNPAEVEITKEDATRPLGAVLAPLVQALFNEESFFRSYYQNFYSSWASQL